MQLQEFNTEGRAPVYAYERSPVNQRAFMIVRKDNPEKEPRPVGDYTILDKDEDLTLAEKKVMNIISLLNGRKKLVQLGHETNTRVLYHIVNDGDNGEDTKIVFYQLESEGVSRENALFRFKDEEEII
jgi:hypothetical protein